MDKIETAPETKADLAQTFDDFMRGFEAFKETNDRRLVELEQKGTDPVTTDKLARIEASLDSNKRRMDEMVLAGARPALGGASLRGATEQKSAFDAYVRGGDETGLRSLERKALTAQATESGFNVPVEAEVELLQRLTRISPIRSIAGVRQVSSSSFRKPIITGGLQAGWAAETDDRAESDASFTTIEFNTMELYAMPAASSALLDDSAVDMEAWLADEVEAAFAEQETAGFVIGNGVGQPRGFATDTDLGAIKTGVAGSFSSTPGDDLIDLVYEVKSGYRQNGHFVMNRSTQAAVRKMKDADGNYIWTPPAAPGTRAMLLNFPVVEAEDMPEMADPVNPRAIAFGDFRRGYLIVDRTGLRVLRDPYSKKPYVLFYVTKRVGGGVQDFDAIKCLEFAA